MPDTRVLVTTTQAYAAVDVTEEVRVALEGWPDGPVLVSMEHTTAGLVLGPADEGQMRDYARFAEHGFADLSPFQHQHVQDDVRNGREHLLSTVVGTQVVLRIEQGAPVLGRWQRVLLLEFDGPKQRRLQVASLAST